MVSCSAVLSAIRFFASCLALPAVPQKFPWHSLLQVNMQDDGPEEYRDSWLPNQRRGPGGQSGIGPRATMSQRICWREVSLFLSLFFVSSSRQKADSSFLLVYVVSVSCSVGSATGCQWWASSDTPPGPLRWWLDGFSGHVTIAGHDWETGVGSGFRGWDDVVCGESRQSLSSVCLIIYPPDTMASPPTRRGAHICGRHFPRSCIRSSAMEAIL